MEFKKWMILNEGMMKLPMEFIKPVIDYYFDSNREDEKIIKLDLSKSGFEFKRNYEVDLACGTKKEDDNPEYAAYYSPHKFSVYYLNEHGDMKRLPLFSSGQLESRKEITESKEVTLHGTIVLGMQRSPVEIYSLIEHEVLHFVQDILAFDVWLFSKNRKGFDWHRDQAMNIGAFKARDTIRHSKEYGVDKLGHLYMRGEEYSGRNRRHLYHPYLRQKIQHSLRPVEFQTNLNSNFRRLERKYVTKMLNELRLKTHDSYEQFLKNLEDENFIKNYLNNSLNKYEFFKKYPIWRLLPFIEGRDYNISEEIKKYYLKQIHKNFMQPMSDDLIKFYVDEYRKRSKQGDQSL